MKTTIFDWWEKQGKTLKELAGALYYNYHYLCDLKRGYYPVTISFKARCVFALGDQVASLFFDDHVGQVATICGSTNTSENEPSHPSV